MLKQSFKYFQEHFCILFLLNIRVATKLQDPHFRVLYSAETGSGHGCRALAIFRPIPELISYIWVSVIFIDRVTYFSFIT